MSNNELIAKVMTTITKERQLINKRKQKNLVVKIFQSAGQVYKILNRLMRNLYYTETSQPSYLDTPCRVIG